MRKAYTDKEAQKLIAKNEWRVVEEVFSKGTRKLNCRTGDKHAPVRTLKVLREKGRQGSVAGRSALVLVLIGAAAAIGVAPASAQGPGRQELRAERKIAYTLSDAGRTYRNLSVGYRRQALTNRNAVVVGCGDALADLYNRGEISSAQANAFASVQSIYLQAVNGGEIHESLQGLRRWSYKRIRDVKAPSETLAVYKAYLLAGLSPDMPNLTVDDFCQGVNEWRAGDWSGEVPEPLKASYAAYVQQLLMSNNANTLAIKRERRLAGKNRRLAGKTWRAMKLRMRSEFGLTGSDEGAAMQAYYVSADPLPVSVAMDNLVGTNPSYVR